MLQTLIFEPHHKGDDWEGITFFVKLNGAIVNLNGHTGKCSFKRDANAEIDFEFKTSDNTMLIPSDGSGRLILVGRKMEYPAYKYVSDLQIVNLVNLTKTYFKIEWAVNQDITPI